MEKPFPPHRNAIRRKMDIDTHDSVDIKDGKTAGLGRRSIVKKNRI